MTSPVAAPFVQVAQVSQMLADLAVLARYVAGRGWVAPPLTPAGAVGDSTSGPASAGDVCTELLVLSPEAIARESHLLEQLYRAIEVLTRLAAPATVSTLRLTRAFVREEDDRSTPAAVASQARRLRRWAWATAVFGLVVFFTTIALLVHVDRGRRAVQQLEHFRAEHQLILNNLALARNAAGPAAALPRACAEQGATGAQPGPDTQATRQEQDLCIQLRTSLLRRAIIYRELWVWNAISERLSFASPITWLSPSLPALPGLPDLEWQSTELRTAVMITSMTGCVLPILLGMLGACVHVYREIDGQIQAFTLEARESVHGTLRILFGAILGGLLGAVWTDGKAIQLEGVSLSLGALALFVGFSVEVAFRLVDALVTGVADRISKRPG